MDNQNKIFCVTALVILSCANLYLQPCPAQDREKEPPPGKAGHSLEKYGEGMSTFLDFYQRWISPVKGGDICPMYPSCSQYANIAFHILPWYVAYFNSFERLLRCGHELCLYPAVQINGKIRWYDPVSMKKPITRSETTYSDLQFRGTGISPDDGTPYKRKIADAGFADHLFREGEHDRAITEYYRLVYAAADSADKASLLKNIGLCYFHGREYEGYISFLEKHRGYFAPNPVLLAEMTHYLGKSYYHLNNYQEAISALEWGDHSPDDLLFSEDQLLLGISYARIFDWHMAVEKLELIEQDSPLKVSSENIIRSLKNVPKLPRKNPVYAGIMSSLIPGAGYLYAGRKGTGVTSFIVNGLFIWTIRDAIIKEQYGLASAAGFLGIGWYIGNIKGSADAARIYNTNIRNRFIDRLLEKESLIEYKKDQPDPLL